MPIFIIRHSLKVEEDQPTKGMGCSILLPVFSFNYYRNNLSFEEMILLSNVSIMFYCTCTLKISTYTVIVDGAKKPHSLPTE